MTQTPSEIQGGDPPTRDTQTNSVHGPPEVDRPGYGGQLWPAQPSGESSGPVIPALPREGTEPRKPGRSGRRVVLTAVLLAIVAGTFVTGLGIGGATTRKDTQSSQPGRTYDAGFADGLRTGSEDGYATGLVDGRVKGFRLGRKDGFRDGLQAGRTAGRERGYQEGYAAGSAKGFRTGWFRGCKWIFEELETNRVIDRVPSPGETYWYLTRDQC